MKIESKVVNEQKSNTEETESKARESKARESKAREKETHFNEALDNNSIPKIALKSGKVMDKKFIQERFRNLAEPPLRAMESEAKARSPR